MAPATPIPPRVGTERVTAERLELDEYLDLYQRAGAPLRWDQRLKMPREELRSLLASERLAIYVLREASGHALGLCEFDRTAFPEIELENFSTSARDFGRI